MKKIIFALAFMMTATICAEGHKYYYDRPTISIQSFYDELLPYGEWINTPDYGYAWRPYLDDPDDFRPYATGGNWVYTGLGWTWVSDYRWGWATFHYGRWYFDDYLGWMWIPGYEWAPAWVTWGSYNDCWAWAPMGPDIRVNVNLAWFAPSFWWTFVPRNHFCSDDWYSYRYNQPVTITNITYITNIYNNNHYRHGDGNWFYGPRVGEVERHLKSRVPRMQLVDADNPGRMNTRNNRVSVYRPGVTANRGNERPLNYRSVETARAEQGSRRTAGVGSMRIPGNENANRRSPDRTYGERYREAVPGADQRTRKDNIQKTIDRAFARQNEAIQRNDIRSRQEVRTGRPSVPESQQPSRIERTERRTAPQNNVVRNNTDPGSARKSQPARSSSSPRTRNN